MAGALGASPTSSASAEVGGAAVAGALGASSAIAEASPRKKK